MREKKDVLAEKILNQRAKIEMVKADIDRLEQKGPGALPKLGRLKDKLTALYAALQKHMQELEKLLAAEAANVKDTVETVVKDVQAP